MSDIYYNNVIYLYKTTKDSRAEKRIIGIITKQGGKLWQDLHYQEICTMGKVP